jgi:hypothetical protein
MHPGYPDATQTEGSVAFHDVAFTAEIAAATRAGVATTSQSVSMDLTTLPFLTAAHIDGADAGTAAQPITTWTTESAAPATTAGVGVAFTWTSTPLDGGSSVYGSWTILAPPSATSVRAPALPASDSDYVPASNAVYGVTPQVALLQGSAVPSYAVLRAQFGALLPLFSGGSSLEMPPLAADGTLAVSVVYPTP